MHLHQLDHKVNVVQGVFLNRITSHKILGKIRVGFSQNIEEINQGKAKSILFSDKNDQVKESETK